MTPNGGFEPLDEDEQVFLEDFLAERAAHDIEGVLGLLHAAAVAPGLIAPNACLELVFPPHAFKTPDEAQKVFGLFMRLWNEVIAAVAKGEPMIPDDDAVADCESFARGFFAGVQMDPEWVDHPQRFELGAWAGMLSDEEATPAVKKARAGIRAQMDELILVAYETFLPLRRGPQEPVRKGPQVGRNDPCPCGSGKKFKKCCAA